MDTMNGQGNKIELSEDHKYTVDGARVPGFTEICLALGIIQPSPFYTEDGRKQGTAIHSWMLFLAQGNTAKIQPEQEIAGRIEGFKKFLYESRFKFLGGEDIQFEPNLRYCCKPDLYGQLGTTNVVIEVKRGAVMKSHLIQTVAQSLALKAGGFRVHARYALYLKDSGDYRLIEHTDKEDETRWKAIVGAYWAKSFYLK